MLTPDEMDEITELVVRDRSGFIPNETEEFKELSHSTGVPVPKLMEYYQQVQKENDQSWEKMVGAHRPRPKRRQG